MNSICQPDIWSLLRPKSVAVVGASRDPKKISGRPARYLAELGFSGPVYLINPALATIDSSCFASVADLPEEVDVAIIALRREQMVDVIPQLPGRAKNVLVFASGFDELNSLDPMSASLRKLHAGGVGVLGPNTVGMFYRPSGAGLTFTGELNPTPPKAPANGIVAISQSGGFGATMWGACARQGLYLDGFVGTGNENGYEVADFLEAFLTGASPINDALIYLETVRDGMKFQRALSAAAESGVRVVALRGGKTVAGRRAAESHTAALTQEGEVVTQLLDYYGVHIVNSDAEIIAAGMAGVSKHRLKGIRIGIVTPSGGSGVIGSDLLEASGLEVPLLSESVQSSLRSLIPEYGSTRNPVDATGNVLNDATALGTVLDVVLASGEVDGLLTPIMKHDSELIAKRVDAPLPIVAPILNSTTPIIRTLIESGVTAQGSLAQAVWALGSLRPHHAGPLPKAVRASAEYQGTRDLVGSLRLAELIGATTAPWAEVQTADDAVAAAKRIGVPVVVKANANSSVHKLEADLIRLGLRSEQDVRDAARSMLERARSVVIQRQVSGRLELIFGLRFTQRFGHIVVAGIGGTFTETIGKVLIFPAGVPIQEVEHRLRQFVDGFRGGLLSEPELRSFAALLHHSTEAALRNGIKEFEINPLLLTSDGLVAVDARWMV